jgi:hypothetical protein
MAPRCISVTAGWGSTASGLASQFQGEPSWLQAEPFWLPAEAPQLKCDPLQDYPRCLQGEPSWLQVGVHSAKVSLDGLHAELTGPKSDLTPPSL